LELVYLWVEDYKNIKRQGFNFLPRFRCEYDEKTNELTIDENDDYIPDFFGKNINVTAIVGKNGSGKSSVLEYLSDSPKFIVTFENDEFQISENIEIINKTNFFILKSDIKLNFQYIVSSDYIINNSDKIIELEKNTKYPKDFIAPKNNLEYMFDEIGTEDYIFHSHEKTQIRQIITFFNSKSSLNKIIFPKRIHIFLNGFQEYSLEDFNHSLFTEENIKKSNLSELVYILAYDYMEHLISWHDDNPNSEFDKVVSEYISNNQNYSSSKKLFLNFENFLYNDLYMKNYLKIKYYCSLFDTYHDVYIENKIKNGNSYQYIFMLYVEDFNPKIVKYAEWDNGGLNLCKWDSNFSSGEIGLMNLLTSLFRELEKNNKTKYIYIDEGETFLHPNWQKKYISYIVQFIKDNFPNRKIHIILTSHSPFLLSDIPKQNIIFLDKDENGNCKVVNGLKEKKQTFGANIHTLLSDSFFMEDGLMGEFAKSKIDKAIKLLNKEYLTQDELKYCEQIISIIGEPIVKNQLQRMLDSKRLKKVDKIDAIEKDIEALKAELLRLRND